MLDYRARHLVALALLGEERWADAADLLRQTFTRGLDRGGAGAAQDAARRLCLDPEGSGLGEGEAGWSRAVTLARHLQARIPHEEEAELSVRRADTLGCCWVATSSRDRWFLAARGFLVPRHGRRAMRR